MTDTRPLTPDEALEFAEHMTLDVGPDGDAGIVADHFEFDLIHGDRDEVEMDVMMFCDDRSIPFDIETIRWIYTGHQSGEVLTVKIPVKESVKPKFARLVSINSPGGNEYKTFVGEIFEIQGEGKQMFYKAVRGNLSVDAKVQAFVFEPMEVSHADL